MPSSKTWVSHGPTCPPRFTRFDSRTSFFSNCYCDTCQPLRHAARERAMATRLMNLGDGRPRLTVIDDLMEGLWVPDANRKEKMLATLYMLQAGRPIARIAWWLNCSQRSVERYIHDLKKEGLL